MNVLKFNQFVNEAKADKNTSIDLLIKLLKEKPEIKMGNTFPDEKGAYSIAGIKKYFKENGLSTEDADDILYRLHNEKEFKAKYKTSSFNAKNYYYDGNYPYRYMDLTDEEVSKIKAKLESESKEQAKPKIQQRIDVKKKSENTKKAKEEAKELGKAKRSVERATPKKTAAKKPTPAKKTAPKKDEEK